MYDGSLKSQAVMDDDVKHGPINPSSPCPVPTVRKKVPVHLHPPSTRAIVQKAGAGWSMRLIGDYEDDKTKLQ